MLESRLEVDEERISELEQNVIESKQAATTSEQLLLEVSQSVKHSDRICKAFFLAVKFWWSISFYNFLNKTFTKRNTFCCHIKFLRFEHYVYKNYWVMSNFFEKNHLLRSLIKFTEVLNEIFIARLQFRYAGRLCLSALFDEIRKS